MFQLTLHFARMKKHIQKAIYGPDHYRLTSVPKSPTDRGISKRSLSLSSFWN